jgi:hypothetical protein
LIELNAILGMVLVIAGAALIFFFALPTHTPTLRDLRPIPAFQRLRRAIGLAVEEGKRLHVSIGKTGILNPNAASGLAGLSTLERIARISIISDRPPVATSGDATLAILSQDTLRAAYRENNAQELYDPERGRQTGATPFSYTAGTLAVEHDEQVSATLLVGSFGPEAAFLAEASQQEEGFTLAASDSLPAQATLYATAEEPLIGEEVFAVPAYLQASNAHLASLRMMDILRWVMVAGMLGGALLKILGVI